MLFKSQKLRYKTKFLLPHHRLEKKKNRIDYHPLSFLKIQFSYYNSYALYPTLIAQVDLFWFIKHINHFIESDRTKERKRQHNVQNHQHGWQRFILRNTEGRFVVIDSFTKIPTLAEAQLTLVGYTEWETSAKEKKKCN